MFSYLLECVLLGFRALKVLLVECVLLHARMCSLLVECVPLLTRTYKIDQLLMCVWV